MEARFSSRVVKTTEQGRLLLSDSFRPILSALWSGCHTISDIANRAGVDFNTAYYRVRQLESNGLVQVGSIVKRKGRGIKYHELTADSYKVPFSLTSHDTITDFVQKDFRTLERIIRYLHLPYPNPLQKNIAMTRPV
ncbi:ArsR/SmtB family transcription factor [Deinococcus radiophilus]|uniref:ArsR family transcriptional regulator n=1 Tax=Deinococcus radiophilus TaxID=32062 RepID=A0A3S0I605_9DEIO|nr:ArsR family transcriptional regulator [Deinococcus radiophilus]